MSKSQLKMPIYLQRLSRAIQPHMGQVAFFGHRLSRVIAVNFASHISSSNIKFLVYMTTACEVGWNLLIDIIPINHPIIVRSRW